MAQLRIEARYRDGRVYAGYTPGFDPSEGSIWYAAVPGSPAGTLLPLERLKFMIVVPDEGGRITIPAGAETEPDPVKVRVVFTDGDELVGWREATIPGAGFWLRPEHAPTQRTRAFVAEGAAEVVELCDPLAASSPLAQAATWPELAPMPLPAASEDPTPLEQRVPDWDADTARLRRDDLPPYDGGPTESDGQPPAKP